MRFLPSILVILLSFTAFMMTIGRRGADARPAKQRIAIETGEGLKMSIRTTAPENSNSLRIHITFENVSDDDALLNLGMMLANGKTLVPDAIRLVLNGPDGQSRELKFHNTRVAGRIDDYIVPLRAGSAYTIKLSLKEYWCPETKESYLRLNSGRYELRAKFIGKGARHVNSDTEGLGLIHFWTGKLNSDVAMFEIVEQD